LLILPASGYQHAQGNGPDAQVFLLTLDLFPWWMHERISDWRNLRAPEVYLGRNKFVENALKKTFPRRGVAVRFVAILWLFWGYNLKNNKNEKTKKRKNEGLIKRSGRLAAGGDAHEYTRFAANSGIDSRFL
jgi:hypothetical protein